MCDIEANSPQFHGIGQEQLRLGFIRMLGDHRRFRQDTTATTSTWGGDFNERYVHGYGRTMCNHKVPSNFATKPGPPWLTEEGLRHRGHAGDRDCLGGSHGLRPLAASPGAPGCAPWRLVGDELMADIQ
eukprot:Skav225502  [mRNA]  locus=scaffold1721:121819:122562:- [translate_table: standard]